MSSTHLIAHQLSIGSGKPSSIKLGNKEIPQNDQTQKLINEIKSGFLGRLSRQHGNFAQESEASPLSHGLTEYLEEKTSFIEMTGQLIEHFKTMLSESEQVIDTHAICFAEENGDTQFFYLILASMKSAFTISDELTIKPAQFLDLGPSLFGIKVDITEWIKNKNYAYLSLVPPRGNRELIDIFHALTGFSRGLDKVESTDNFLAGVEAFSQQVPQDQVDTYRKQVVDYCVDQDERDNPVDLRDLSHAVEGIDSNSFTQFMSDYTADDENALMMDRRRLRRYVKFTGREKDLAISFSSSQLNNRVQYNPNSDTLSIKGIPRALRDQLLQHLNN